MTRLDRVMIYTVFAAIAMTRVQLGHVVDGVFLWVMLILYAITSAVRP